MKLRRSFRLIMVSLLAAPSVLWATDCVVSPPIVNCDNGITCTIAGSGDYVSCTNGVKCTTSGTVSTCNNGVTCSTAGAGTPSDCSNGQHCFQSGSFLRCTGGRGEFVPPPIIEN